MRSVVGSSTDLLKMLLLLPPPLPLLLPLLLPPPLPALLPPPHPLLLPPTRHLPGLPPLLDSFLVHLDHLVVAAELTPATQSCCELH
jgi:hypothetical protein